MNSVKYKTVNSIAALLSKSSNCCKMAKLITKIRDNDCNSDMQKNGEEKLLRYLIEKKRIDVLFDVGANVGDYLSMVLAHSSSTNIYAFEPGPRTLDILKQKYSSTANLIIIEKALSETEGFVDFYQHDDPLLAGSDSIHNMATIGYDDATTKYRIDATTLDLFCRGNKIDRISFLKCDVEGNELAVLKGGRGMLKQGSIDYIQFEFGHAARAARVFLYDICGFLAEYGYAIYTVKPKGIEKFVYSPWEENKYNMNNFFAVSNKAIDTVKEIAI